MVPVAGHNTRDPGRTPQGLAPRAHVLRQARHQLRISRRHRSPTEILVLIESGAQTTIGQLLHRFSPNECRNYLANSGYEFT